MTKNDGGTAFPMQDGSAIHAYAQAKAEAANSADVNERDQIYLAARAEAVSGMSLRDYFAAKAMAAMIHSVKIEWPDDKLIVSAAYRMADAMLMERAK